MRWDEFYRKQIRPGARRHGSIAHDLLGLLICQALIKVRVVLGGKRETKLLAA